MNDEQLNEQMNEQDQPQIDGGSCGEAELFALQVLDDSMEPEFAQGCIIVIDPSGHVKNGAFVLARLEEEDYIFRQFLMQDDRYYLKPMKTGYDVIEIPGPQVIEGIIVQRAGTRRSYHKHYD